MSISTTTAARSSTTPATLATPTPTPTPATTAITIVAARHFAGDKAAFTHRVLIPAIHRIRALGAFSPDLLWPERHWLHGPFVGIAISDAVPESASRPALAMATDLLTAGTRTHPSTSGESPEHLLAGAHLAGRIEGVPGPYDPIRPDNSVDRVRPDRRHLIDSWGSADALALRDRLVARSVDLVDVACAHHADHPRSRVRTAITLMSLHATSYAPGATGGAMSFLSHLEDFLHRQPAGLRARFEAAWVERADELTTAVGAGLAGVRTTELERAAYDWSHEAVGLARTAYAEGRVPLLPPPTTATPGDLSAFHQWVPAHFDPYAVAADFGPYRCATNVLYAVLVLADVRPIERYLAAFLLSRAVSRLTGIDWVEIAENSTDTNPTTIKETS